MEAMEKYIWIVHEENHGAVSYFDSVEKAIEEMKKIVNDIYGNSIKKISQEENYIYVFLQDDEEVISAERVELNKSWVD